MNRIRTSKHSIKFSNTNKLTNLDILISEYRRCLTHLVSYIWNNGYSYTSKGNIKTFNIQSNQLDCPSMLTSDVITKSKLETFLTGRALKCCLTQAAGMIKAATLKQKKRLYFLEQEKLKGTPRSKRKQFIKKLKCNIPQIPNCDNAKLELNSICSNLKVEKDKHFDSFLRLTSITKNKMDIKIPIQHNRHSLKLQSKGKMLNSFLIGNDIINIRWELPSIKEKQEGIIVGADQGKKDVLTLSNGTVTSKTDCHGHSLDSIILKVSKKKKGSNAFRKAKTHQKNFVNWSINNLNLKEIKQINLEKIWNIGYKNPRSRLMSHWCNTIIRDKIQTKCENEGVRFTLQSCTYRSQRCSNPKCGYVNKLNRKGKAFICRHCGNTMDADLNASSNHVAELPEIPYRLRQLKLNHTKGFFWKPEGFFDSTGRSLQSLLHVEDKH